MRKVFLCLVFSAGAGATVFGQPDTSPFKVKDYSMAANYAGGVDKSKVMDYFQDQQFDEALGYLSRVLQRDSDNIPVLSYAGYAYYMNDNAMAARACYERMLGADAHSVTALHYLVMLSEGEDAATALGFAQRLLQEQPQKAAWWRVTGELFGRTRKPDSALYYVNRAYAMAPGDVKTVVVLGNLLCEAKAYGQVDSIVDIALQKDSMNVSLLKLRVRSAYLDKQYGDVLVPGERLLRLNEPAVNPLAWLALSYYDLQQYPDCIRVCEGMLDMGMDLEAVYYYEARAQAKLHNYDTSNALMRKALAKAKSPTMEWYYEGLGDNFESLRAFRKAIAHYDTAFYLFREPLALYTCGRIAETGLKNMAMARLYYRRYLAIAKPESPEEMKAWRYVKARWGKK